MPTGLRHRILTPGTNVRRTLHGAVNLVTGAGHHHISVKNVPVVFGYFLQQLLVAYPNAPVIAVICDNGSTHHSKILNGGSPSIPDARNRRCEIQPARRSRRTGLGHDETTDSLHRDDHGQRRIHQAHAFFEHRANAQNLATAAPWTSPWLPPRYGKDFWQGA